MSSSEPNKMDAGMSGDSMNYASFMSRLGAYVIDGLIMGAIYAVITTPIAFMDQDSSGAIVLGMVGNLALLAWVIYNNLYLLVKDGATVGKKALKIKVVKADGGDLTWGVAIMREVVGKFVSGLTSSIGYIIAAFTSRKQALHDYIAKTVVVKR